jgi:glycogen debranching enzyme
VADEKGEPNGTFANGFAEIYALLFANLQKPDALSACRYATPGPAFRGVYLWDSAFIAQIWKWWQPEVACDVLRAVIELRDGDRLQHVVSEFTASRYTQPPLIAWSAAEVGKRLSRERRLSFYRRIYSPLKAYRRWLQNNRQLENGLYFWEHPYESGVENAPRFSSQDERELVDTRPLAAPDLSSYMVLQAEALGVIAQELGEEGEAAQFHNDAETLRSRIRSHLWHEEDGMYYDLDTRTGRFVRSRTIASLLPLWAGAADTRQTERLVTAVTSPTAFGSPFPLPSVALDDRDFVRDMWRGPVWINTAYGAVQGILRMGRAELAASLAFRLCQGVYQVFAEERHVYEFYDPENFHTRLLHRKRGNLWKAITLGTGPQTEFVGWSGLVNTLMIEVLFGLQGTIDAPLGLRPRFPTEACGWSFTLELNSRLPRLSVEIGDDGTARGNGVFQGEPINFEAGFGEELAFASMISQASTT